MYEDVAQHTCQATTATTSLLDSMQSIPELRVDVDLRTEGVSVWIILRRDVPVNRRERPRAAADDTPQSLEGVKIVSTV
jgi:hypothetical protein